MTNSVYSEIFGVPISVLGMLFYGSLFLLSLFTYLTNSKKWLVWASQATLAGFLTSLMLIYLQIYVIQQICFYCMISALTSTTLFIVGTKYLFKQKTYLLKPFYKNLANLRSEELIWVLLRISMGFIFLWTFVDKAPMWLAGGSPTLGFLENGTSGVFADLFFNMSGNAFTDLMYMFGLFSVGVALILGIQMKLAAIGGSLIMLLIYLASALPPAHNPIVDEHIIYILVLWGLYKVKAGQILGLDSRLGAIWKKKG